jgi:hypothetical protein
MCTGQSYPQRPTLPRGQIQLNLITFNAWNGAATDYIITKEFLRWSANAVFFCMTRIERHAGGQLLWRHIELLYKFAIQHQTVSSFAPLRTSLITTSLLLVHFTIINITQNALS